MKQTAVRMMVLDFSFSLTAMVSAADFTDSYGDFTDNQAAGLGITFMPAKAILDPAGTTVPQKVYLKDWTSAKSSSGYGGSGLTFPAVTTYDAVTKVSRVYVDGSVRNQVTYTGTPTGSPADLIFRAEFPDARVAYIGLLDDVRIWSYPLDAVAVARLYTHFTPGAEICTQYPVYNIAGPEGVGAQYRDCRINFYDFMPIAEAWLECNIVSTCI
ncbi:MAG: hypothetical protein JXB18_08200 [Sedimentisphaerales bacterium]|nr:hypothetical protein [Sedimentisphaerales bacterium]